MLVLFFTPPEECNQITNLTFCFRWDYTPREDGGALCTTLQAVEECPVFQVEAQK